MEAQKGKNNILFERLFRSKKISTYGKAVENATEIAEQFNSYFCSIAYNLRSGHGNTPSDLSKFVNFAESCKDPDVVVLCSRHIQCSGASDYKGEQSS